MAIVEMDFALGGDSKVKIGTFTAPTNAKITVDVGFRPRFICCYCTNNDAQASPVMDIYIDSWNIGYDCLHLTSGGTRTRYNFEITSDNRIYNLTDTGFIFNKAESTSYNKYYYYAIG